MHKIKKYTNKAFDDIRHTDENDREYWLARELQHALGYAKWENFHKVIKMAMTSCRSSNISVFDQFPEVRKLIIGGKGNKQNVIDYKLTRYACYLIVQNADPRKEVVALGQTYFAVQTRKQELLEEDYNLLSEDQKRLYQRNKTKKSNADLSKTALLAGVKNFDKFHNAGYRGLYGGETADDIARRKGLRYREEILDNMSSDELIANLFRISQTNQKIKRDNIRGEEKANKTHYIVGKEVRNTIERLGGIMPEELPTPKRSLTELEKDKLSTKNS